MDTTFIYFLKDPENPNKGYVGKTDNPKKRGVEHLSEAKSKRHYRANWIKSLAARGLRPSLYVIDEVPFEHWPQLEVAYIEFFLDQGYELVNGTPGGEGCGSGENHPSFGYKHTPEAIAKIRARSAGKNNPMYGKPSPMLGKKASPETVALRTGEKNSWFGKHHSAESIAKQRAIGKIRIQHRQRDEKGRLV